MSCEGVGEDCEGEEVEEVDFGSSRCWRVAGGR